MESRSQSEIRKSNPNARIIFIAQNNDYLAETVLYSFAGGADGLYPRASLIQDAQGNSYGTTMHDGAYGYWGTVFVLLP